MAEQTLQAESSAASPLDAGAICTNRFRLPCVIGSIFLLTVLAYLPALRGDFIWDDDAHVTKPALQSLDGLVRIWFELGATQQYYPLLYTAFWVEHKLWGDATLGYHLVNVLLHATAACLIYFILRKLAIPGAYLAAMIFALHPVHVESVAWISEQKNTLSAVFYLSALLAYLHFDDTRGPNWYGLALGLFVLGLLCKTVIATLPAALLVIFWWQRGRIAWERDVAPLMPMFALGAVAGLLTTWLERKLVGAEGGEFELSLIDRGLLAGRVIWFYFGKLVWPTDLVFIYPRWQIDPKMWWQWLFPLAALGVLLCLWSIRLRWRAPLAGWLLFVGTLFPVLGFLNVYPFLFSYVADHFQYLASLGIIVLAASGMSLWLKSMPPVARRAGSVGCMALVGVLTLLTWRQSRMYNDAVTLYETTLVRNPACWMAHSGLGVKLAESGQVAAAIEHHEEALRLYPKYGPAHNNLGVALAAAGRLAEAIAEYERALELQPNFAPAHNNLSIALTQAGRPEEALKHSQQAARLNPGRAETHYNLGLALSKDRRWAEAADEFERSLRTQSDQPEAHNLLGVAQRQLGRSAEAVKHFKEAIRLRPDYAEAYSNLGNVFLAAGESHEAMEQYQQAVRLNPNLADAHSNLGVVFYMDGQRDAAIQHYEQAVKLNPAHLQAFTNLAVTYAEVGRTSDAIDTGEKAIKLARSQEETTTAKQLEEWLKSIRGPSADP